MGDDFLPSESFVVKFKSLGFQSRSLGVGFEPLEVKFWFWQCTFLGLCGVTFSAIGLIGMGESWASWCTI